VGSGTWTRCSIRIGLSSATASRTKTARRKPKLPVTTERVTIEETEGGKTRMLIEIEFPTVEAMEQLAGLEEGRTQSVGQIDAILAGDAHAG
jgi:hypothetical protein